MSAVQVKDLNEGVSDEVVVLVERNTYNQSGIEILKKGDALKIKLYVLFINTHYLQNCQPATAV